MNNKTTNATEQLVAWWSEFNSEVDEYEYIIILRAGEHGLNEDTFIPYPRKEILDVLCRFGVDNHIFTELLATVTGDELFRYLDALKPLGTTEKITEKYGEDLTCTYIFFNPYGEPVRYSSSKKSNYFSNPYRNEEWNSLESLPTESLGLGYHPRLLFEKIENGDTTSLIEDLHAAETKTLHFGLYLNDWFDHTGNNILHLATQYDNLPLVKFLHQKLYMDIHQVNKEDQNLLHIAAMYESHDCLEYLLDLGIINAYRYDNDGKTPFDTAVFYQDVHAVKLFHRAGEVYSCHVSRDKHCNCTELCDPVSLACVAGDLEMVKCLIEVVGLSWQDNCYFEPPIWSACYSTNVEVLKYLLERHKIEGSKYNLSTDVYAATFNNKTDHVRALFDSGLIVNYTSDDDEDERADEGYVGPFPDDDDSLQTHSGSSSLYMSVEDSYNEIIDILLAHMKRPPIRYLKELPLMFEYGKLYNIRKVVEKFGIPPRVEQMVIRNATRNDDKEMSFLLLKYLFLEKELRGNRLCILPYEIQRLYVNVDLFKSRLHSCSLFDDITIVFTSLKRKRKENERPNKRIKL